MKAIIYCRVSTNEQAQEGHSLKTQERLCKQYAKQHKIEVVKTFIEQGESAKTINRTALKEMMKYCKLQEMGIEALLIYKIDRLSRDSYDYAGLKAFFTSCNVKIVSITEPIEDSPIGRFIENTMAGIAQFDNEIRGERCRNGMIEALKEGRWIFPTPYGFKRIGSGKTSNIEPQEDIAKAIRKVFELVTTGIYTQEEIRLQASQFGLVRKNGKPIAKSHFYKMLRKPVYKGYIDVPSMGLSMKGSFPYIVKPDLFNAVQSIIDGKTKKMPIYKKVHPDFPLRGTIKCTCDKKMTSNWSMGKGGRYGYYRCSKCQGINIRKEEAEEAFKEYLNEISIKPEIAEIINIAVKSNWEERSKDMKQRIKELQTQKHNKIELQDIIIKKNCSGVITDEIAKRKLSESQKEIATIELELSRYSNPENDTEELLEYSIMFMQNLCKTWEENDVYIKNKFQKFLFPDGLIYQDGNFTTMEKLFTVQMNQLSESEISTNLPLRRIELRLPD